MLFHVMPCYVILCYAMPHLICHVMLSYVRLCCVKDMLCYVMHCYMYIVRLRPCGQPCGNRFHVNVTGLRRPVTSECNRSPPPHIFTAYLFGIVSMYVFAGKPSLKPKKNLLFFKVGERPVTPKCNRFP